MTITRDELIKKRSGYLDAHLAESILANEMAGIASTLRVVNGALLHVCDEPISKVNEMDVLVAIDGAEAKLGRKLSIAEVHDVIKVLGSLDMGRCRIDVGKLAEYFRLKRGENSHIDLSSFVRSEMEIVLGRVKEVYQPTSIVIYAFGRIGRLLLRILLDKIGKGDKLLPMAFVVRSSKQKNEIMKRLFLLRNDTVHGKFKGRVFIDEETNSIVANGAMIQMIVADDPSKIDYTEYGIDNAILVETSGNFKKRADAEKLLTGGISKVVLSYPGEDDILNIVPGINHEMLKGEERIVSGASCTTNAIVPAVKLLDDAFGIVRGHVESIHAVTNDQKLTDNYHKKDRRGRAAMSNIVPTSTGADKAITKALPHLKGKFSGSAVRVPVLDVSFAILALDLEKEASAEKIIGLFREASLRGPLMHQIGITFDPDAASSDFIGTRCACTLDVASLIVMDPMHPIVKIWYDNEFGYTCQLMRLIQLLAGINLPEIPLGR